MLTKNKNDEGPCPKCKKPVGMKDLTSVGGGSVGSGVKPEIGEPLWPLPVCCEA